MEVTCPCATPARVLSLKASGMAVHVSNPQITVVGKAISQTRSPKTRGWPGGCFG